MYVCGTLDVPYIAIPKGSRRLCISNHFYLSSLGVTVVDVMLVAVRRHHRRSVHGRGPDSVHVDVV
jgi:hypothetical protein